MSRVINDVRILSTLFTHVFRDAIIQIPTVIVLLGIAFYRKWDLTLLTIMLFPLIAYSTRKFGKRVKKRTLELQKKLSFVTHRLSETIRGAKVIKVFNREDYRDQKFEQENQRVYRETMKVVRLKETTKLMVDIVTGVAIGFVLWYAGTEVRSGTMTAGDFASVIAAIYMVFAPIKKLGEAYNYLQEILAALERIESLIDVQQEEDNTRKVKIEGFSRGIQFDHVSFVYDSEKEPALKDIDLEIHAGELLALVGPSGAGKTTLSDLIPRFYDPTEGSIKLDGIDIRDVELKSLRDLVGIVSQDIVLFNDTVRENIAFGNEGARSDAVQRAAEMAYATEFIEKLPRGYESDIGDQGLNLSGGQRQRLAIARAILKNPPILILDEATSSLDRVSESLVQKALEGLMKERTTLVIAHRLSTIKNADRIVVLEDGRITSMGTHDELLTQSQTYSKLCSEMVSS
jgi:subfamily B ATP-binding cassette protein MsbA